MKRFFDSHFFILLIILVSVIFIRFNRISELGYFMMDEERDGFLVRRMLVDHRPLLIGGSIPGGINVGPGFFYISAVPYYLGRLNPQGPAYVAALIGVLSVAAIYFIGRKLFDGKTAILAAVFSGFSLLNIIYQRPWWPLTMSQVVVLLVYLSLWKLSCQEKRLNDSNHLTLRQLWVWLIVLTGALILGVQSDPSTLSLIPLSIIWLWWHRKRSGLTRKHYLTAAGLFVLAHATWVVFEFRHDFMSTRAIMDLITGVSLQLGKETPDLNFRSSPAAVLKMTAATVYRLFFITGPLDVTKQISPAEIFLNQRLSGIRWFTAWGLLVAIFTYSITHLRILLQGYSLKEYPLTAARALLGSHFLFSLAGMMAYTALFPGYVHEWMWAFMFPAFFLIAADILINLSDKVRPWVPKVGPLLSLGILGFWGIWGVSLFLKLENVAGLGKKLAVVQAAQAEISGRPYELRSEGEGALRYGGWRYLFTLYGDPPVKSYMDYVYDDWVYPKSQVKPEVIVVVNNQLDEFPAFTISE